MKTYTFQFYQADTAKYTRSFQTDYEEDAYKMADNVLRTDRSVDDWELLKDKIQTQI